MKKVIGLGFLVAILFTIFVLLQDYLGASAFYMAAIAMAMFTVLGPLGDYLKTAIALLIGVVVALAGMIMLAAKMPLPPDNLLFVALVSGVSLFLLVLISTAGMRIDAMFLGWAAYFAAVFGTYTTNTTAMATLALQSCCRSQRIFIAGLFMSLW